VEDARVQRNEMVLRMVESSRERAMPICCFPAKAVTGAGGVRGDWRLPRADGEEFNSAGIPVRDRRCIYSSLARTKGGDVR
jgi:hypothetical protein